LSTVVQKGKGGKFDITVVNLGAEISENQTQKLSIPIRILTETGLSVEAALKAKQNLKNVNLKQRELLQNRRLNT